MQPFGKNIVTCDPETKYQGLQWKVQSLWTEKCENVKTA